jgi:sodium-dependent dicarboxylate transporter 2/3/5
MRLTGLFLGPIAAAAAVAWSHPSLGAGTTLDGNGSLVLGVLVLMAIWWMTTAIDMAATSLLPVLLFPALGVGSFKESAAGYSDNIIFLFGGGAALGLALERTGVSSRFASALMSLAGSSPTRTIIALFAASAFISPWVSNTATAAMMLPVAVAAIGWIERVAVPGPDTPRALRNFGIAALLAVAYGASVGGLLTLIGSPPNAIAAEWLNNESTPMTFVGWMKFAVPVFVVFAPLAIGAVLYLNPVKGLTIQPGSQDSPLAWSKSPMSRSSWTTLAVFALAATAWIAHPFIPGIPKGAVTDGSIAVAAALVLFVLPASLRPWQPILRVGSLKELPWGVLVLFGGGLSLAEAMQRTGLSSAIGESFSGLAALPIPMVVGAIVAALVFTSEIASNTALTATAVPILGALAPALGVPPEQLVIPAAFGASYAFMMPVGTPPNAMVYATGRVPLVRMLHTGLVLNVLAVFVITALATMLL